MLYDLLELLLGGFVTKQGQKMPKCKSCKKRMEKQGAPRLFLLPVYSDGRYPASADYFRQNCVSIQREEQIPTARRACRIWRLRCPVCGTQHFLVQDFLRVRQDELLEGSYLYAYPELAELLLQQPGERTVQVPRRMEDAAQEVSVFSKD